jgi:hypothetical protein
MKIARNHQPCRSPVSEDQVVPRLRPGGRKKLWDGFETQEMILLFRHFEGFTDKRKLLFQRTISFTLIIQGIGSAVTSEFHPSTIVPTYGAGRSGGAGREG